MKAYKTYEEVVADCPECDEVLVCNNGGFWAAYINDNGIYVTKTGGVFDMGFFSVATRITEEVIQELYDAYEKAKTVHDQANKVYVEACGDLNDMQDAVDEARDLLQNMRDEMLDARYALADARG